MSENYYDIVVVGGGPMGLSAAYQCAIKENKKENLKKINVLVLEKADEFRNTFGSSPGFSRQFRTSYSESNLCELAIDASGLWDELMNELDNHTLLYRTGCLWFGDATVSNSEGNIDQAVENLKALGKTEGKNPEDYYDVIEGKAQIMSDPRFRFVSQAVKDVERAKALFVHEDGGTINVPALIDCLTAALECSQYATLLPKASVTSIDYSEPKEIRVRVTVRASEKTCTEVTREFRCAKVILTPGAYVNNVLSTLTPAFPKRINLTIYLWSSTYFRRDEKCASARDGTSQDPSKWPIWYFFGQPKPVTCDGAVDSNAYYGFPSEPCHRDFLRVAPAFTSKDKYDFHDYPPSCEDRPIDPDAMQFTSEFVQNSMPSLSSALVKDEESTCIAGFAESIDAVEDDSAGFVLDFLPDLEESVQKMGKRIVVFTGGWGMKFVPVIGKILVDLALRGKTDYARLIEPMNINRGILEDVNQQKVKEKVKSTPEQRAAMFNKMSF